jgi:hypothetical protein
METSNAPGRCCGTKIGLGPMAHLRHEDPVVVSTRAARHGRGAFRACRRRSEDDRRPEKRGHFRAQFGKVLAINSSDKAAAMYVERCDHLSANPPPEDWTGVWVMESK